MAAILESDQVHIYRDERTAPRHGLRARTDSGFGEADCYNANTNQSFIEPCGGDADDAKALNNAFFISDALDSTLIMANTTHNTLQRQDSVTNSLDSNYKRQRENDFSRRSSTQSSGPAMSHVERPKRHRSRKSKSPRRCHYGKPQPDPMLAWQTSMGIFSPSVAHQKTYSPPVSPRSERLRTLTNMSSVTHLASPPTTRPSWAIKPGLEAQDDEEVAERFNSYPATAKHFTSPETRQEEYAEIKRRHSGFSGFVQRTLPKPLRPNAPANFHDETKPYDDDKSSVRRYRIEVDPYNEMEDNSKTRSRKERKSSITKLVKWFS